MVTAIILLYCGSACHLRTVLRRLLNSLFRSFLFSLLELWVRSIVKLLAGLALMPRGIVNHTGFEIAGVTAEDGTISTSLM
jgi:hypothetical protein